jgi:hypothetical protein
MWLTDFESFMRMILSLVRLPVPPFGHRSLSLVYPALEFSTALLKRTASKGKPGSPAVANGSALL